MEKSQFVLPLPTVVKAQYVIRESWDTYKMISNPRGTCLVINNMIFDHLKPRRGSEEDVRRLRYVFTQLGFTVIVRDNLTTREMKSELRRLAEDNTNANSDAMVIVILSHGDKGIICGTEYTEKDPKKNNMTYDDVVDILNNINCPLMRKKPKLCFIQACQGSKLSVGVEDGTSFFPIKRMKKLPEVSDLLLSFSAQEGFSSARNPTLGSIYITHLTDVLADFAHERDLLDMLSVTERRIRDTEVLIETKEYVLEDVCLSTYVKLLGWSKKLYFNVTTEDAPVIDLPSLSESISLRRSVQFHHSIRPAPKASPPPIPERRLVPSIRSAEHKLSSALGPEMSLNKRPELETERNPSRLTEQFPVLLPGPSQKNPTLWVIGGETDPEMLAPDGQEWIHKVGTGLERWHKPVVNSQSPIYVYHENQIFSWNPKKRKPLTFITSVLKQQRHVSFAYLEGDIYAMGGEIIEGEANRFCKIFHTHNWTWIPSDDTLQLTRETSGKNPVVFQGKIYLPPGGREQEMSQVDVLDPSPLVQSWKTLPVGMLMSRCGQAFAACQRFLWAFGGISGRQCVPDVERYCPVKSCWEKMKPMPTARTNLSVAYFNGKFYAMGGETLGEKKLLLDVVEIYDLEKNEWKKGPSLQLPRSGHGSIVF